MTFSHFNCFDCGRSEGMSDFETNCQDCKESKKKKNAQWLDRYEEFKKTSVL